MKSAEMDVPPENGPGDVFTLPVALAADPLRVPCPQRLLWQRTALFCS